MTNKPSINNSNKSRNIKLIECTYNGPNKRGDFKFEIKEELKNPNYQGQKTLWLFNDNHKHRLTSKEGGGNAVIRPYNKYGKYKSNPLSAGITTGTYGTLFKSGKGYESLDEVIKSDGRSARNNIDDDMKNIKELLKTGNYNKVKIITDENGLIGNKIFKIDIEVKHYIKDELNKVIDELNNSSSLQNKFNHIKKFNVMNNSKIPNHYRTTYKQTPYLKKLKNKFSKKKKDIYETKSPKTLESNEKEDEILENIIETLSSKNKYEHVYNIEINSLEDYNQPLFNNLNFLYYKNNEYNISNIEIEDSNKKNSIESLEKSIKGDIIRKNYKENIYILEKNNKKELENDLLFTEEGVNSLKTIYYNIYNIIDHPTLDIKVYNILFITLFINNFFSRKLDGIKVGEKELYNSISQVILHPHYLYLPNDEKIRKKNIDAINNLILFNHYANLLVIQLSGIIMYSLKNLCMKIFKDNYEHIIASDKKAIPHKNEININMGDKYLYTHKVEIIEELTFYCTIKNKNIKNCLNYNKFCPNNGNGIYENNKNICPLKRQMIEDNICIKYRFDYKLLITITNNTFNVKITVNKIDLKPRKLTNLFGLLGKKNKKTKKKRAKPRRKTHKKKKN